MNFTFISVILHLGFVLSKKFVPYIGIAKHSLVSTSQTSLATPVTTGGAARSTEQSMAEYPAWQRHTPVVIRNCYCRYYYLKFTSENQFILH